MVQLLSSNPLRSKAQVSVAPKHFGDCVSDKYPNRLITIAMELCDSVQSIHQKHVDRRLDWAITSTFAWNTLASELSGLISKDGASTLFADYHNGPFSEDESSGVSTGENFNSASRGSKRAREAVNEILRNGIHMDALHGDDCFWQAVVQLRAALATRQQADAQQHVQRQRYVQLLQHLQKRTWGVAACGEGRDSSHNPEVWQSF